MLGQLGEDDDLIRVDEATYRLRLEGKGLRRPVEYSIQQLKSRKFK